MQVEEGEYKRWQVQGEVAKNMADFYSDGENQAASDLKKYYEEIEKFEKENEEKEFDDYFIQYTWSRRRKVWDKATLPVFFDLGNEIVWIRSPFIAKRVPMDKFLKKYGM